MCGNGCCVTPMGNEHSHGRSRKFFTKEERIKQLEKYVIELKDEIKALEELISEIMK